MWVSKKAASSHTTLYNHEFHYNTVWYLQTGQFNAIRLTAISIASISQVYQGLGHWKIKVTKIRYLHVTGPYIACLHYFNMGYWDLNHWFSFFFFLDIKAVIYIIWACTSQCSSAMRVLANRHIYRESEMTLILLPQPLTWEVMNKWVWVYMYTRISEDLRTCNM